MEPSDLLGYQVLRERGTEKGGTGPLLYHWDTGAYHCAGCGHRLFSSEHKYDSGTGWPAFSHAESVDTRDDDLYGMKRLEAICPKCDGHLGHLFDDLDSPSGRRYCINSAALRFRQGTEDGDPGALAYQTF